MSIVFSENRHDYQGDEFMVFDDKIFIAKKIKLARKKAGYTQEELAEKIGITSKQVSRIELGTYIPSLPTFLKIVKILEINLNDFGLKNPKDIDPVREEFMKLILSLPDPKLKFCLETVRTLINNFDILKYN